MQCSSHSPHSISAMHFSVFLNRQRDTHSNPMSGTPTGAMPQLSRFAYPRALGLARGACLLSAENRQMPVS